MTATNTDIRAADTADLDDIRALLAQAALPFEDIAAHHLPGFAIQRDANGELLAAGGIERHGQDGLLRSVVVHDRARGAGLGARLVTTLEQRALADGLRALYLLTTTAAVFFEHRGYTRLERRDVPAAVQQSTEFASLCPASATCMKKTLEPRA